MPTKSQRRTIRMNKLRSDHLNSIEKEVSKRIREWEALGATNHLQNWEIIMMKTLISKRNRSTFTLPHSVSLMPIIPLSRILSPNCNRQRPLVLLLHLKFYRQQSKEMCADYRINRHTVILVRNVIAIKPLCQMAPIHITNIKIEASTKASKTLLTNRRKGINNLLTSTTSVEFPITTKTLRDIKTNFKSDSIRALNTCHKKNSPSLGRLSLILRKMLTFPCQILMSRLIKITLLICKWKTKSQPTNNKRINNLWLSRFKSSITSANNYKDKLRLNQLLVISLWKLQIRDHPKLQTELSPPNQSIEWQKQPSNNR